MAPTPSSELTPEDKQTLLSLARVSIQHGLEHNIPLPINTNDYNAALTANGCCFVTLHLDGNLRGCIGSLTPYQPLVKDVVEHAFASAFRDSRFARLSADEFDSISISISVLTNPEPMTFDSEENLLEQLTPFQDGLILEVPDSGTFGRAKGTFLPSVWEQLPDKKRFLNALKVKAGLPESYWSASVRIQRYRTVVFS